MFTQVSHLTWNRTSKVPTASGNQTCIQYSKPADWGLSAWQVGHMEQQESGGAGGQIRMMCFKWGAKKYEHLKISFDLLTLHDNKRLVLLVAP